jgi:hypothetical protein
VRFFWYLYLRKTTHTKQNTAMTSFRLRPRFRRHFTQPAPELIAQLKAVLKARSKEEDARCIGVYLPENQFIIKIKPEDQHFWSPQLALTIEQDEEDPEGRTVIRGLYGPSPNIWTFFMFCYGALGILALFISMVGFSSWSLNDDARLLWLLPLVGGLALGLYLIGQFGQKLGVEQTFTLHHFLEDTLHERIKIY